MAAASFHTLGLGGPHHQNGKVTKSRARSTVKPILKKLHHSSYSEKNSLDLDRGWEEQPSPHPGYVAPEYSYGPYFSSCSSTQDYDAYGGAVVGAVGGGGSGSGLVAASGTGTTTSTGTGTGRHSSITGGNSTVTTAASTATGTPTGGIGSAATGACTGGTSARSARDVSFNLSATDLTKAYSAGGSGLGLAGLGGGLSTTTTTTTISHTTTASTVNSSSTSSNPVSASASNSNHNHSHSHSHSHSQNYSSHYSRHARSTSGTSHISVATSTTSGGRNGSFVHPFQQTPRTSTPPLLSYANSVTDLDNNNNNNNNNNNSNNRDYSPTTITENDYYYDDDENLEAFPLPNPGSKPLQPPSGFRRPSLTSSQRTSFQSDVAPALRLVTSRAGSGTASRAPSHNASAGVNQSRQSDAQLSTAASVTVVDESPLAPPTIGSYSPHIGTSANSTSPMSPLRNSLDMNNFRIRSRSDVDTATRQEQVRAARRKFEEKERAKDEKYAREQVRKRERADTKEAQRHERAQSRKGSMTTVGRTSSSDVRPAASRKSTGHSRTLNEKKSSSEWNTLEQDDTSVQSPGRAGEVHFERNKRSRQTAKRKTNGAWTSFVLWLRTRLLKLGRR